MNDAIRICAVIPSHNHWRATAAVIAGCRAQDLPVFLIDDGSSEPARSALAALGAGDLGGGKFYRCTENLGKGGAVLQGFQLAMAAGFTHVLQIDADGQHDIAALPRLLEAARAQPEALVTGVPVYDASIPTGRAIGRWITHVWVWVETLSFQIRDSMCGFRVYPLAAVARLLVDGEQIGRRMDFDTDIMVRLFWRGCPVVNVPVAVTYPTDNISNFDLWRDNCRISLMHTRLVFTLLWRLLRGWQGGLKGRSDGEPRRSDGQGRAARHWAWIGERGTILGLRFCLASYRLLGRQGCRAVLMPIVLYFYLTGQVQREASRQFLDRAFRLKGWARAPSFTDGYRHFLAFAMRGLDTFIGWAGAMPADLIMLDELSVLREAQADPRGALVIVAHVGNADISRAMLDAKTRERLLILVHTRHAENYNRVLKEVQPAAALNTLQVSELGPDTAIALKERVDQGQWVIIAGDRVPVNSEGRTVDAPFMGETAAFSVGPYILGSLLECPVYLLFCLREDTRYRLYFEKFADAISLPRSERAERLRFYAEKFAARLQDYALRDPFQWFNFFDFWAPAGKQAKDWPAARKEKQASQ
ncbi:MAG TPA: glycosyltransferase [Dongiaceae bacterium]|nr:glycosyltransferase [Dongiaceae bacterium]